MAKLGVEICEIFVDKNLSEPASGGFWITLYRTTELDCRMKRLTISSSGCLTGVAICILGLDRGFAVSAS